MKAKANKLGALTVEKLVERHVLLKEVKRKKLYEEMDAIVDELRTRPAKELHALGYEVQNAFAGGKTVVYGLGPVKQWNLVKLKKEKKKEQED